MTLEDQLTRDEGLRLFPYRDSNGKLTIGIGRNLDDAGISTEEADFLFSSDIAKVRKQLAVALPWTQQLNEARRGVLENMAFNMGIHGLLQFRNALERLQKGDLQGCAKELLNSLWAIQVGDRAQRLAKQIIMGEWQ